ncbi:MAG: hypothetical protein BWY76_01212 [bacterium ADurb.Bin429]|nr:MAG: hypothetical protein BWY76_01212 [bacterium ADurb.Bin429]
MACTLVPALSRETIIRQTEAIAAGHIAGAVMLLSPGGTAGAAWYAAAALAGDMPTLRLWTPRTLTPAEGDLLAEYAAWRAAAEEANPPGSNRERRARTRCRERSEELRPAVERALTAALREGRWHDAAGGEGELPEASSLAETLAEVLAPGFDRRYPLFAELTSGEPLSRAACQQILTGFIEPGEAVVGPQSLLGEYLERFAAPLGCVAWEESRARVAPPRWELLEPLLTGEPRRLSDALELLGLPPLGLTGEQARLAVLAAVRAGALRGLDAFLQPLDPETPLARSDALAFVAPPAQIAERYTPLVRALAARWEIPLGPWPIACSQVECRLRAWLRGLPPALTEIHAALADWTTALGVMPWGWEATGRLLDNVEHLVAARQAPVDELCETLANDRLLDDLATAQSAMAWWRRQGARATVLCAAMPEEAAALREALVAGERAFAELDELTALLERLWRTYREAYQRWHEGTFGAEAVNALRALFDGAPFKAVKALMRLPLPAPEVAVRCLDALAQARAGYCPGLWGRSDEEGVCGRCRLPLCSPSPMPAASAIAEDADAALRVYAALLAEHPWSVAVRARLPRAPEEIAARITALLDWPDGGDPASLLAILDEPTLAWLARDDRPAASRRLGALHPRLHGRDLTLGEARQTVEGWLNPDGTLDDNAILGFE